MKTKAGNVARRDPRHSWSLRSALRGTPERIARLSTTDISNALENLVDNEAIDAALDDETSCCQECNEWIPYDEPSLVNEWHDESCSLYPSEESESA